MKIVITEFTKKTEFRAEANAECTTLTVGIHPVLSVNENDGTAEVSHEGVQPTIMFNGQIVDHTDIIQALHDMADMIAKQLDNKTVEDLVDGLRRPDNTASTSGRQ